MKKQVIHINYNEDDELNNLCTLLINYANYFSMKDKEDNKILVPMEWYQQFKNQVNVINSIIATIDNQIAIKGEVCSAKASSELEK